MALSLHPLRALVARLRAVEDPPADPPLRDSGIVLGALMTEAIREREKQGEATTLRQLHTLLDISQPTALRIAHLLSREGVVRIEENPVDHFESTVRLTPQTRECFVRRRVRNIVR